jgi:nitrogenase molybdenum-iron protein beta chain
MQWMYYGKNIPKKFYMIGGSFYTLALTKFLVNDAGFVPLGQFAVDNPPNDDEVASIFKKELSELDGGIAAEIVIENDPVAAQERIRDIKSKELIGAGPSFFFGSAWDYDFAKEINSLLLQVGAPNTNVVFTEHFFGYRGGLNLLEFIFNAIPNVG